MTNPSPVERGCDGPSLRQRDGLLLRVQLLVVQYKQQVVKQP